MRFRNLLLASMLVLGVVAMTAGTAGAVAIGIQIEVFKNGVSQGTAFGGASTSTNTPWIVTASAGDTLRFVVQFDASYTVNSWNTQVQGVHDPTEIDFVPSSGLALSGWAWGSLGSNPNSTLITTPDVGNSNNNGVGSTGQNMYEVSYIVQAGVVTDGLRDFSVLLSGISTPTGDTIDAAEDSASVRVDTAAAVPEPASLLLLGSGLAGLVGFGRKKFRK